MERELDLAKNKNDWNLVGYHRRKPDYREQIVRGGQAVDPPTEEYTSFFPSITINGLCYRAQPVTDYLAIAISQHVFLSQWPTQCICSGVASPRPHGIPPPRCWPWHTTPNHRIKHLKRRLQKQPLPPAPVIHKNIREYRSRDEARQTSWQSQARLASRIARSAK
jgi:hypothetical protein